MAEPIKITSLRGGMNNTDPPSALSEDQCVEAIDVEFFNSTCGERRQGCEPIILNDSISSSGLDAYNQITFLFRHLPEADETESQLWAFGLSEGSIGGTSRLVYKDDEWHIVVPDDAISIDDVTHDGYQLRAASIHDKMFLGYKSAEDRLHVWDGTDLRRVGLRQPEDTLSVSDNGAGGTFVGTRFYRFRYIVKDGDKILRRSEPSEVTEFTPVGTDSGVDMSEPDAINEGETHWELEASTDNNLFYVIHTYAVGLATILDADIYDYRVGYAIYGELSEDVGDYTVPHSAKFLIIDSDRVVMGGSHTDITLKSTLKWTPVANDPGVGNDERIPLDTDNQLDLDGSTGGELTNLCNPVNGYIYATKIDRIYRITRENSRQDAYTQILLTDKRGALEDSAIEAVDQAGSACLYFLDRKVGPCRITRGLPVVCAQDIHATWQTVNVDAIVSCRAQFYPEKHQVIWWIATDDAVYPNLKIVLQTDASREFADGVRKGWVFHTVPTGTHVFASCLYATNIDENATRNRILKPFIGTDNTDGLIAIVDEGTDDCGTDYFATLTTRPTVDLTRKSGVAVGAILATADPDGRVNVAVVADFGLQEKEVTVLLAPESTEEQVIKPIDNLSLMNNANVWQVRLSDDALTPSQWEVNEIDLIMTDGQSLHGQS